MCEIERALDYMIKPHTFHLIIMGYSSVYCKAKAIVMKNTNNNINVDMSLLYIVLIYKSTSNIQQLHSPTLISSKVYAHYVTLG